MYVKKPRNMSRTPEERRGSKSESERGSIGKWRRTRSGMGARGEKREEAGVRRSRRKQTACSSAGWAHARGWPVLSQGAGGCETTAVAARGAVKFRHYAFPPL